MKLSPWLAALFAAMAMPAYSCDFARLKIRTTTLCVELARTPDERARGLSGRSKLANDEGMLFVFPEASTPGFWMRDTRLPLSIAFIDASAKIVDIRPLTPFSESLVYPERPVAYALEVPRGWFDRNGIKLGDRLTGISNIQAEPTRASSRAKNAIAAP